MQHFSCNLRLSPNITNLTFNRNCSTAADPLGFHLGNRDAILPAESLNLLAFAVLQSSWAGQFWRRSIHFELHGWHTSARTWQLTKQKEISRAQGHGTMKPAQLIGSFPRGSHNQTLSFWHIFRKSKIATRVDDWGEGYNQCSTQSRDIRTRQEERFQPRWFWSILHTYHRQRLAPSQVSQW